ncbi:MAG: DUF5916 domain-containing protein [Planctomycetota bacterium]|nr:DUF5916 domain-containing protein [Planctomycetota bacterium]
MPASWLLLASATLPVAVQDVPTAAIARLPDGVERPSIDGVLDDPAWEHAALLGPLTQVEPVAGAQPSERTEVRLLHDAHGIFVAVTCFDSDPSRIIATQMRRDARLDPDDSIEFYLDTFLDRRNCFWFQMGPTGVKGDALITKNGSFNKDFDTIWHGKARITAEGWVAEIEVPTASLNFDPGRTSWGFNFVRSIRRRNEKVRWASSDPKDRFFSVSTGGTLTGIGELQQGVGLDVVPFGVLDWSDDRVEDEDDFEADGGFDAFYKLTPNSKLSLSYNTDFAETEVDQQIVNLTRFQLFFPEKRDFFLEDSGNFFFGPTLGFRRRADVIPFFSRRIGLDDDGAEVPLTTAVKLTGQTAGFTYGILDVQTDDTSSVDSQNLFAARFSKHFLEQSDVGVIVTSGDPEGGDRNGTYGVDLNLRTNTFRGDENLRFSSYVLQTDTDNVGDQDLAYFASVSYPNDEVNLAAEYLVVERNFDPALGFVRRDDVKKYSARLQYRPRLHTGIRNLDFQLEPTLFTNAANETETVDIELQPFGIQWESGDRFNVELKHQREVLDEDFEILDPVVVPAGSYTFNRYGARFQSSNHRPVSIELDVSAGEFFDGDREDYKVELDWRPGPHVTLGTEYELNAVSLGDGDFDVHTARLRANFVANPEVSWSNFLQYDNVSNELSLNSRLRWILEPGRELNFVINQGWEYDPPSFSSLSTQTILKVSYTIRF